jgi:hypothetical protein
LVLINTHKAVQDRSFINVDVRELFLIGSVRTQDTGMGAGSQTSREAAGTTPALPVCVHSRQEGQGLSGLPDLLCQVAPEQPDRAGPPPIKQDYCSMLGFGSFESASRSCTASDELTDHLRIKM